MLKVRFRLEGGYLFFVSPKKRYEKKCDPMSAPSNHLPVITRSPALRSRSGRFRQAIPGLSKTASASLPRPRLRAAIPLRLCDLGAAKRGGTAKAKAQQRQHQKLKSQHPPASSPRRRGSSSSRTRRNHPSPQPPPARGGGLKAGRRDAFDSAFDVAVDVHPVWLRRASQLAANRPARGRGSRQGCRRFHPQAMDGLWVKPVASEKRRGVDQME